MLEGGVLGSEDTSVSGVQNHGLQSQTGGRGTQAFLVLARGRSGGAAAVVRGVESDRPAGVLVSRTDVAGTASRSRMDLYPDNTAHSLTFAGAFNLAESTRFMASISPGWMLHNDPFVPFTINTALSPTSGIQLERQEAETGHELYAGQ